MAKANIFDKNKHELTEEKQNVTFRERKSALSIAESETRMKTMADEFSCIFGQLNGKMPGWLSHMKIVSAIRFEP